MKAVGEGSEMEWEQGLDRRTAARRQPGGRSSRQKEAGTAAKRTARRGVVSGVWYEFTLVHTSRQAGT